MKGLMTFVAAVWACAAALAYDFTDAHGVCFSYDKVPNGSGLRLDHVTVTDTSLFNGRLEVPEYLNADGQDLPVTMLGTDSIGGKSLHEVRVPPSVTLIAFGAFFKSSITNVIFACNKPTLENGWTGELVSESCVFSILPAARGWGKLPGELTDSMLFNGELIPLGTFALVATGLNPAYAVTLSPEGGAYRNDEKLAVTISRTVEVNPEFLAKIYYTTDGSEPDESSRVYAIGSSIMLRETTTVKAYQAVYLRDKDGSAELFEVGPTAEATYQFPRANGGPYVEEVDGTNWTYMVKGGKATIERVSFEQPAVPVETAGELTLPAELGLRPVAGVGVSAFERCRYLTKVVFPETVTTIASFAFKDCLRLKDVVYAGEKPAIDLAAFDGCPLAVVPGPIVTVKVAVPIEIQADPDDGTLDIPENWLDLMAERFGGETWKTQFTDRFGDGSTNTLKVATGKVDRSGHALQVWQEYVAGTDPLDADSALTAFVEMTAEGPVITWSPDLSDEGRVYTIYGMKNLTDRQKPTVVTALTPAERQAAGYRFFFVAVRLAPAAGGAE